MYTGAYVIDRTKDYPTPCITTTSTGLRDIGKCSMLEPGIRITPDTMSYKNAYTDRYHSTIQLQHNVNSLQINSSRKHAFLIVPPRNTCSLAH
jgi:hypothetical protein